MESALSSHERGELVREADGLRLGCEGEIVFARGVFHKLEEVGWLA